MALIKLADIRSYNRWHCGAPYAGVCSLAYNTDGTFAARFEVDFSRGVFKGDSTYGGPLFVNAGLGDLVTWGQKDHRGHRPNYGKGFVQYGVVRGPDEIEEIDSSLAFDYLKNRVPPDSEPATLLGPDAPAPVTEAVSAPEPESALEPEAVSAPAPETVPEPEAAAEPASV